jgi:hypothetical protein
MEYDKTSISGIAEAKSYPHDSTAAGGRDGKLRINGPNTDVGILEESITFPFSGRTAKNRFLKGS